MDMACPNHQSFIVIDLCCSSSSFEHWRDVILGSTWKTLFNEFKDTWKAATPRTAEEAQIGFLNFRWVRHLGMILFRHLETCKSCLEHSLDDGGLPTEDNTDDMSIEDSASSCSDEELAAPELLGSKSNATNKQEGDESRHAQWTFEEGADDYHSSPIQSKKSVQGRQGDIWTFSKHGVQILPTNLDSWTDRGFRLTNLFFRTVDSDQPAGFVNDLNITSTPKDCEPKGC